ncbi:hypothetical protein HDV64DRAFT_37045 [Trichoderma sp. TUCIM 5745]
MAWPNAVDRKRFVLALCLCYTLGISWRLFHKTSLCETHFYPTSKLFHSFRNIQTGVQICSYILSSRKKISINCHCPFHVHATTNLLACKAKRRKKNSILLCRIHKH